MWSILRWEHTELADRRGRPVYLGHFTTEGYPADYEQCQVLFSARHPVLAMRKIAKSGRHPMQFANTVVN